MTAATPVQRSVRLPDGRLLEVWATEPVADDAPVVLWHHGTPHTGRLLPPLLEAAGDRGIRLVTYARPGYGGSTVRPGRDVASAATDAAAAADAVGVTRFAVVGASGGGPHALTCAALLAGRVTSAVTFASPAPFTADADADADWFAGMRSPGALQSAVRGREARLRHAQAEAFETEVFTPADWAALAGPWAALGEDAGAAAAAGEEGAADDDVAFVRPWGLDLAAVAVPTLVVHGEQDRMVPVSHAQALARAVPGATVWRRPAEGHVSVLRDLPAALDRVLAVVR